MVLAFYFSQCKYASAQPFLQQIKWRQQQNISNRIITINNRIIAMEIPTIAPTLRAALSGFSSSSGQNMSILAKADLKKYIRLIN